MLFKIVKKLTIILYVVMVCLLAVATFVEQTHGTAFIRYHVYHTIWFCCLWGGVAVTSGVVIVRNKLWYRLPLLFLHGAFGLILAGALVTFVCGKKGHLHLVAGNPATTFVEQDTKQLVEFPFTLQLDSFRIEHYPGTDAPLDYISYLRVIPSEGVPANEVISMNRIFSHSGFRFYQASCDEDGRGSWLSVNYDPWGSRLTYAGYLLLGFSMLWVLLARSGGFRCLLRHPLLWKGMLTVFFLLPLGGLQAQKLPVPDRHQADSLAREQVIYHDRVVPFNTLARDFVLKLTGKPSYGGLSPEQIIGGWLLHPEIWKHEPMILIKNAELRRMLQLPTSSVCLADLFDGQTCRLQKIWKDMIDSPTKETALGKAILEADEKVGLVLMLQNGTLIRPLPKDGSVRPLSGVRLNAELLYNRIPFNKLLFMFNLTLGVLAFARLLYGGLRKCPGGRGMYWAGKLFTWGLYASFLFHAMGYGLRWYIGSHIPLSNGYETMQFMALCALLAACLLQKRFVFMLPFGFLLSGFVLLVAYLGQMNPQITPLMPALVSPWLSAHVSLIMMSYVFFAFMMLNGVLALCLHRHARQLMLFSRVLLYPATFFLEAGIFMGAVWANVSWGRYWAWDPKEVWALITFMVYGVAFHANSLHWLRRPLFFHLYIIAAFLTVLMTYFGVNYVLGGLHSYANA